MGTDYVALAAHRGRERDQLREQLTASRERRISLEREREAALERAEKAEAEAEKWEQRAKSRRAPNVPPPDLYVGRGHYDELVAMLRRVMNAETSAWGRALAALERENERLAEIERIFNEGWLPAIPGEGASLKLRSLHELRDLIPPVSPPERVSEEDKG